MQKRVSPDGSFDRNAANFRENARITMKNKPCDPASRGPW